MQDRNAASVLPLPVGARTSVESPRWMAGQACAWAGVGAPKDRRNHAVTAPWNGSSPALAPAADIREVVVHPADARPGGAARPRPGRAPSVAVTPPWPPNGD